MAKKEQFELLARKMFVENQKSVAEIAREYNLTEKTVHRWKKAGNWAEERQKFLKSIHGSYTSLYEFIRLILDDTVAKYKETQELPDYKYLSYIRDLIDKLPKLKQFENELVTEKTDDSQAREPISLVDQIMRMHEAMMGG